MALYEMHRQVEKVSENTGKTYKKWVFVGWDRLPNLDEVKHVRKGQWLVITFDDGSKERFNVEGGGTEL